MRWLLFFPLCAAACTTFGTDDPAPGGSQPPALEAGPPPVDAPPEGGVDASRPDAVAPCDASETLSVTRDAIMNTGGTNLSDQNVCNLSVGGCLVAFDLVASRGKSIVGLQLVVPRSVSTSDCTGGSCLALRGPGTIEVSHARPDWTEDAYVKARNKQNALWAMTTFGPADYGQAPLATANVNAQDVLSIALEPKMLDGRWSKQSTLAFHVRGASPFQFVIERRKGSVPPLPSLKVTYCP